VVAEIELCRGEALEWTQASTATRYEYELTPTGTRTLAMVMTALRDWGDRRIYGKGREPVVH
jgi:DNA-binding HxlR family transcriptional regulator